MTKVSNKMISSLLALIMVLSVMTVPVLRAGAEEPIILEPMAYEWDFDNSAINPNVSPINCNGTHYGQYNATNGKIEGLPYKDYGYLKNIINGGDYDSYLQAANGSSYNGAIELVTESADNKVLRITRDSTTTGYPVVAIKFPAAINGEVDIEFDARICIKNGDTLTPITIGTRGEIFSINALNTAPKINGLASNCAVVNSNFQNNRTCPACGTASSSNTIVTNMSSTDMQTFKMKLDYTGETSYTYIYQNGADTLLSHGSDNHPIRHENAGKALETIYFELPALATGELVYDIDNIKVTPKIAAPIADVANGAVGVDVRKDNFAVDFNAAVADADKDAVKLLDASGEEVAADKTVSGTKVYVAPRAALKPQSEYKLVIPAVEVLGKEYQYEEQEIVFYTAKDYVLGTMNFDENLPDADAVDNAVTSAFRGKVTSETGSGVGAADDKLYLQSSATGSGTNESYTKFVLTEAADEIFHAEFTMNIQTTTGSYYPVRFYAADDASVGYVRRYGDVLYFCLENRASGDAWNGTHHVLSSNNEFVGKNWKYIIDINAATGIGTCNVVDSATGNVVKTVTSTSVSPKAISFTRFTAFSSSSVYANVDESGNYINTVELDDILIADMPLAGAKFITPTFNVATDDTPEIEFTYPVVDASALELWVDDAKVDGAEFTLSPDGYTVTVDAALKGEKTYEVKLDGVKTVDGTALTGFIGFITAAKESSIVINDVKLYAADDADKTELTELTAGAKVTAELTFANTEAKVQFDTIVYAGVYGTTEAGGVKLLTAVAAEETVAANDTKTITVTFTVPEGAEYVKVFAWDKFLTPYAVHEEFFNN